MQIEKQVLVDILFISCLTLDLHTLQKSFWLILENLYQLFYNHFVYWSNYKPNWMLSANTGWNVFIARSCLMSPGVGEHTAGMGVNEARCGRWSQPCVLRWSAGGDGCPTWWAARPLRIAPHPALQPAAYRYTQHQSYPSSFLPYQTTLHEHDKKIPL